MNFSGISRKAALGRLLRFPLRFVPHNMILPIMQGRLRGSRWVVGSSNHGCWLGSYEFEKLQMIGSMILPGTVAFDIGAHVGFYTLLFSKLVGPSGSVFAFEPFPENIGYLRKHIQLNRLSNVEIYEAAVADATGRTFFESHASSSMGHITDDANLGTLEVAQVSIDELIAGKELPVPNYLKIDIEGAELRALQGARQTLQQHHPTIFLATHGAEVHRACCSLLADLGYELQPITGNDITRTDEILAKFN